MSTKKIRSGFPRVRWQFPLPRIVLHEKHERRIKWTLRVLTLIGVATSLVSLPIAWGFGLACLLTMIDVLLENTVFYYTSMYVQPLPDFEYDPDKWAAMAFVFFGIPSPEAKKIVGLVFTDKQYASKFFQLLRAWNHGSSNDTEDNIKLTFVTDEDRYYVYLYPSPDKRSVAKTFEKIRRRNRLWKFGKEHFGLIVEMVMCHGFDTAAGYALGEFVANQPQGKEFLIAPFLHQEGKQPEPIYDVEPIRKLHYKAKIPIVQFFFNETKSMEQVSPSRLRDSRFENPVVDVEKRLPYLPQDQR